MSILFVNELNSFIHFNDNNSVGCFLFEKCDVKDPLKSIKITSNKLKNVSMDAVVFQFCYSIIKKF